MRIEAYTQVQQVYQQKNTNKNQKTSSTSFSDQLEISSVGKDYNIAKNAVKNSPDIREEKVASIKEAVQNGTYEVSTDSFANKLLEKYQQTGVF